jgi:hypothetical protein
MFATLDISCLVLTLDSRDLHPARSASLGSAHNVKVSLVRPGFINSNSFRKVLHSKNASPGNSDNPYYSHYWNMTSFIEKLMTRTPCTPESVAKTIYKISCMKHPPLRIAGTPDAWFFSYLRRILPRGFYHWLLYRSLPGIKTWGKENIDE